MKNMKTKLALTAAALAGVVALTAVGTLALFTDQQVLAGNTFNTGTIALTINPTSALVTYSNMMPGDVVTNPLIVGNAGTSSLRYAVSSVATNTDTKGLKDQLVMTIKTIDVTTPLVPCDNFDGTLLYTGDLDSTAGKILGDAAPGSDPGDRTLASGTNETLCFRVSLPLASDNSFQGAATTATFTFDAEQTKNN
jgi:predicted ribosomally synthesized peptide with SipW-like signal peptide